jgi:hypothetical protein
MKKPICYYHSSDLDGWTSAAIVAEALQGADLRGWTHGDPVPNPEDIAGEDIIMVDILLPNFVQLYEVCNSMTWIDHHKSSWKDVQTNLIFKEGVDKFNHHYSSDYAACELCWEYFFPDYSVPESVRMLGLYDSFRHKKVLDEKGQLDVLYFQYYARSICSSPEEAFVFTRRVKNRKGNI